MARGRARERRYMNRINGWDLTASGVEANADDVPQLQPALPKLQQLSAQARTLSTQQAALTASKQETSKTLREVLREGDALADFIRTGARAHYGPGSEKLIEFGVQPFRGKKVKTEPDPPAPETAAPLTSSPDTVQ